MKKERIRAESTTATRTSLEWLNGSKDAEGWAPVTVTGMVLVPRGRRVIGWVTGEYRRGRMAVERRVAAGVGASGLHGLPVGTPAAQSLSPRPPFPPFLSSCPPSV